MKHVAKRHEKKIHIERKENSKKILKETCHFLDLETNESQSQRFPCSFCTKTFSMKHVAKRHEKTHTEEGYISCNICDKKFRSQSIVDKHVLAVHTEKYQNQNDVIKVGKSQNHFLFYLKSCRELPYSGLLTFTLRIQIVSF